METCHQDITRLGHQVFDTSSARLPMFCAWCAVYIQRLFSECHFHTSLRAYLYVLTVPSFKLVQMLQPCQHNLFTGLLDLSGEEDFVENCVDLIPPKLASIFTFVAQLFLLADPPIAFSRTIKSYTFHLQPYTHTYLPKIEHQIQFTHVPKKAIQHLHEEVDRLQVA